MDLFGNILLNNNYCFGLLSVDRDLPFANQGSRRSRYSCSLVTAHWFVRLGA